jgi:hypothetical protein
MFNFFTPAVWQAKRLQASLFSSLNVGRLWFLIIKQNNAYLVLVFRGQPEC